MLAGNRQFIPALYVLNKIDSVSIEELDLLSRVPHYVPISATDEWNFDDLLVRSFKLVFSFVSRLFLLFFLV